MTSSTAAYRKDLAAHRRPFSERDGEWVVVAALAEQASLAAPDDPAASGALLDEAWRAAAAAVGAERLTRLADREWGGGWESLDAVTLLAYTMHDAGAAQLASALLDAILPVVGDRADAQVGRMLAQRARIAYQTGEHEVAEDMYRRVGRLGRTLGDAALLVRAELGFTALAHVRGNYPAHAAHARRAVRIAQRAGLRRQERQARYALMIDASKGGRFDDALVHGWRMFELSDRDDRDEAFALQSLGQLMLEMGDGASARAAFAAVMTKTLPPRFFLPALGGLALTVAGETGAASGTLDWAVGEVQRLRDSVPPYTYAQALFECATALRDAGRVGDARRLRDELLPLARKLGYHELVFRGEALQLEVDTAAPERDAATRRSKRADQIVRYIRRLEPARLPEHVAATASIS